MEVSQQQVLAPCEIQPHSPWFTVVCLFYLLFISGQTFPSCLVFPTCSILLINVFTVIILIKQIKINEKYCLWPGCCWLEMFERAEASWGSLCCNGCWRNAEVGKEVVYIQSMAQSSSMSGLGLSSWRELQHFHWLGLHHPSSCATSCGCCPWSQLGQPCSSCEPPARRHDRCGEMIIVWVQGEAV